MLARARDQDAVSRTLLEACLSLLDIDFAAVALVSEDGEHAHGLQAMAPGRDTSWWAEVTLDLERELADTRLAPGERVELVYARALDGAAAAARLSVVVYPDAFYVAFYETLLRQGAGRGESEIRAALEDARRSAFVVYESTIRPRSGR